MVLHAGRSKNAWESPKGCLMFSFTIQMEDGRVVPLLQYVASLALTEAINYVCSRDVSVFAQWLRFVSETKTIDGLDLGNN